jgi:hypothetical protein
MVGEDRVLMSETETKGSGVFFGKLSLASHPPRPSFAMPVWAGCLALNQYAR